MTMRVKMLLGPVSVCVEKENDDEYKTDDNAKSEVVKPLPSIHKPPPPFHQRLKKKVEDSKFLKFIDMLKELSVNIVLVETFEQMSGYAKFMKYLVIKKKTITFEPDLHTCSAIATRSLVDKKEDLGAFTILCIVGAFNFARDLCNLGASINLMLLVIYRQLGFGAPKMTTIRLLMADRLVKRPTGIFYDMMVRVDHIIFPTDFVLLDYKVDFKVHINLGRLFLATGRSLVDIESGELIFRLNNEEVKFNMCKSIKQPRYMFVMSMINIVEEVVIEVSIQERFIVETLAAVIMNFKGDGLKSVMRL
ncbi:uncharacterized protein LOC129875691 [Solanum dulcamara]|uniref:uncharacterized protein LOC129875691 n=1 Tax=Solanum dulcamara TaxID=45834 RepID=UPI0024866250|nr:uncharacterized protein LOC129875691 [Solanum dulcamara]